jgi:hypothetical protein
MNSRNFSKQVIVFIDVFQITLDGFKFGMHFLIVALSCPNMYELIGISCIVSVLFGALNENRA